MKNVEIPKWLEGLPLAPEFHPTDTEFADPIAYISKIEKEASAFGICKVIPPLPKPSRKYVLHNLNKSLSKNPELGSEIDLVRARKTDVTRDNCGGSANGVERRAVFTTRSQELGCEQGKRIKGATGEQRLGAQKQVWQSGEVYTLEEFEAKSKNFTRSQLGVVKDVNPLVIESMFWKASSEKPIYVEYANDVPGSGFGEPEGLLHYFKKRRRRKRNSFDRNTVGTTNSNGNIDKVDSINFIRSDKNLGSQNSTETPSNSLLPVDSHQSASFSGQKDSSCSGEIEGTAGWKLSNSPWNLQVIARSPGSLTRFMPDDIPGVTSPMVYVGMLFSWFAWHVEDHELHSLNFLHMGSPKTWYSVPGDYAFDFEEVIRCHAYGGNTDRLVALSLLGEKTTVLSPEVISASGIPCCRLVQYPGEFVVTFPRAYHIGFSHGFNCGEAANFGTPRWLAVAKAAAIRRAAMNYLPMLSHQQLLYLLTMSFISRIPRSLLPGVRSSRFRDRQKEEKELLVKRAFIKDMLHENGLVTILLQKNPSYRAVLWDLEALPSSSKESEHCKDANTGSSNSAEKYCPMIHDCLDVSQLNNYMNAVGFDLNDDDLPYDFQIDSGTLPCVACGILGFPFMAVVQPSEAASKTLVPKDPLTVPEDSCFLSDVDDAAKVSTEDAANKTNGKEACHGNTSSLASEVSRSPRPPIEVSLVSNQSSLDHEANSTEIEITKGWKVTRSFLRPRIFCLEHAIEIDKLLKTKGGANVLLICHSDFQKIKAHSAVVAEEISCCFDYNEIPLLNASPEDLNLINTAIDSQGHDDCADWTSLLNINLQHYVKVKKSAPSNNFRYLLTLGGLFCNGNQISSGSSIKWQSRKVRSKRLAKPLLQDTTNDAVKIMEQDLETNLKPEMPKQDVKIIQYSRKKYKSGSFAGTEAHAIISNIIVRDALGKEDKGSTCVPVLFANNGNSCLGSSALASHWKLEMLMGNFEHSSSEDHAENSLQSCCANSLIASAPTIDTNEANSIIALMNESELEDKIGNLLLLSRPIEVDKANGSIELNERFCTGSSVSSVLPDDSKCRAVEVRTSIKEQSMVESVLESLEGSQPAEKDFETLQDVQSDEGKKDASVPTGSSDGSDGDPLYVNCDELIELNSDKVVADSEISKSLTGEQQGHVQRVDDQENVVSGCTTAAVNESGGKGNFVPCGSSDGLDDELTESTPGKAFTDVEILRSSNNVEQGHMKRINEQENVTSRCTTAMNESTSSDVIEECAGSESDCAVGTHDDEDKSGEFPDKESNDSKSATSGSKSVLKDGNKRKRGLVQENEDQLCFEAFIRSPCEGLRSRARKEASASRRDTTKPIEKTAPTQKPRKASNHEVSRKDKKRHQKGRYQCDIDGCTMNFQTKGELTLHKWNKCPVQGCRKKFSSHKYALQHQRVHDDDRPLKCPWKGCSMSFKWAWARTEHIRVHTGERPYVCKVKECGLTFRFVSDFSRHRRKTGHYVNKPV